MAQSDEELVRLHRLGDAAAFPELLTRYMGPVYNLAYRSTGDAMEAENLVQETFARAYAALARGRGPARFRPWLFTIAINLCRNWARRAGQAPWAEDGDQGAEAADPAPGPLERLLEREASSELERALSALPLPYRQALVLRYTEGLSYEELSQSLGIPLNTVRTHLFRAKERLRQALSHLQEGEYDGLRPDSAAPGSLQRGDAGGGRGPAGARAPARLRRLPRQSA